MPAKHDFPTEYTNGGTPANRGMIRRLNPVIFLTICCTLFILVIVAALIVFTFLPIFGATKGNQMKYQVQSSVLTLIYNLPDRLSILSMNWTYVIDELDTDKLSILQNLLQDRLQEQKLTRKTSITVMDAVIVRQRSASTSLLVASPVTLDTNNKTVIVINQPDIETEVISTNQLNISLMLRYALECANKCQNNMKDSIFANTFRSLAVPIDIFQTLFTHDLIIPTNQFLPNPILSTIELTTRIPCIVNTPSSILASSIIMARSYEAESLSNTFISTTIQSCSVCSGQEKVNHIGFTSELIFQRIQSQYGGSTVVVFYYITDGIRFAEITVNNVLPSINITFPAMSANQNIASLPVTLNLCQGLNSIRIYNPNDYTPDFDRIIIY